MAEQAKTAHGGTHGAGETRRDFLYLAAGALGGVGAAVAAWPLINSLNPSADVLALATVEVDLAPIAEGQRVTVKWQGKPVFLDHRTGKQIDEARAVPLGQLRDPQSDEQRAIKPEYLVMVGICTHLGCIPKGQRVGDPVGEFGGWFCPCHGSHYDTAGRIRKGPAPRNLLVPPYAYLTESRIVIGQTEEGA